MASETGWTSGPDGRGTFDIISSCLITISLCCWSAVYPSVPGRSDGSWQRFRDKLGLALLTVLGPEFLLILAVGQRASARRAVRQFRAQKFEGWTMEHAFFADMGGFMLTAPDYPPFPIDAAQVLYLVKKGYLDLPQITKSEIEDRDKSDGLSRLIIVFQASWFTVDLIGRAIQGLTVTTLEVTTISFIIILFATSYCWREKPSDVMCPVELKIRDGVTMQQVIDEAHLGDEYTWYRTPLEFVSRYDNVLSLTWHYYNEVARKFLFSPFSRRVKAKPWDRFPPDLFLRTELDLELLSALFILGFGSIFCVAWNFQFPTTVEKVLWRASSIYMVIYTVVGEGLFGLWFYIFLPRYRTAAGLPDVVEVDDTTRRVRGLVERIFPSTRHDGPRHSSPYGSDIELVANNPSPKAKNRWAGLKGMMHKSVNNSPDKDPQLDVPLAFLIPTSFLCVIYVLFRGYILLEDLMGLRSLPPSAYETVSWAHFLPHI